LEINGLPCDYAIPLSCFSSESAMNRRLAMFAGLKVGLVVNQADFFLSHRLELARALRALGAEPTLLCPPGTGEAKAAQYDLPVITYPLSRSGVNPFAEIGTVLALGKLYRQQQFDLVHHITIKPVLYGTFAARRSGIPAVVNAVTGMGHVFTSQGVRGGLRRTMVNLLYRWLFNHPNMKIIFQNGEDRDMFISRSLVRPVDAIIIRGSGVDPDRFPATEEPVGPPVFLFVGRMLADKGVREFVAAARHLRQRFPDWRFQLLGGLDPDNPSALSEQEMNSCQRDGIEWLGHQQDVATFMAASHVVVLPSYREGVPKTLLEAAACGRAIVATDIAGCREIVRPGVNGLLVRPRTVEPLIEAMERLGTDADLRVRMGAAGSTRAKAFSVHDVVEHTVRVYSALLTDRIPVPSAEVVT
jgi:glycosyltransferase involved in cell wall biosynthesis